MRLFLKKIDAELEKLGTVIFRRAPEGEQPPSLAMKLFVFGLLVAVLALAWSAQ
jgi:hypothetical protein